MDEESGAPVAAAFVRIVETKQTESGLTTYATTGALGGAFTGVAAGTTTATIALFHLEEQHNEFSCPNVPLEVL